MILLNIDMPRSCLECKFKKVTITPTADGHFIRGNVGYACLFNDVDVTWEINKAYGCPLKNADRALMLLEKTQELLKKQEYSPYVLNILSETIHYDDTECDGSCLIEDIENELEEIKYE